MDNQAGAKTCSAQLVGRSLAGPLAATYQRPISRASSGHDEKGRGARQVVGASGTWRLSHGHSEEALVT